MLPRDRLIISGRQTHQLGPRDGSGYVQYLVAERVRPLAGCHMTIWSDNSPAASWSTKMVDKATTPIAGQLLRVLAMRQCTTRAALPTVAHYPGIRNLLANTASRSFTCVHHGCKKGCPSHEDTDFLTSFNTVFSLSHFSQMRSWRLVPLQSELSSLMLSTLRGQKLPMQQWTQPPGQSLEKLVCVVRPLAFDKFLVDTPQPQPQRAHVLMAFAARVHAGALESKGRQIGCQAVSTALRHVAQAFVLASYADPRSGLAGPEIGLAFTRLYHSYRQEDPVPRPQLALPVSVFQDMMGQEGASLDPKDRAVADLVMILVSRARPHPCQPA
jgi:hypothetical protein